MTQPPSILGAEHPAPWTAVPPSSPLMGTAAGTSLVLLGTHHPPAGHRSGLLPPFSIYFGQWEGSSVQLRACWHGFQQEVTSIFLYNLLIQPFPEGILLPPLPSFQSHEGQKAFSASFIPQMHLSITVQLTDITPALRPKPKWMDWYIFN